MITRPDAAGLIDRPSVVPTLILASASRIRAEILQRAGIACRIEPAWIDEDEVKRSLRQSGARPGDIAIALAELKALQVSQRHPGALVIGADQILQCGEVTFDKPLDSDRARAQLTTLRGQTHELLSALVVARDGVRLWHYLGRARLRMREFSDRFLDEYLARAGSTVVHSVGAYQFEGLGAQLFAGVEGDYFTILGLPLIPLLDYLRDQGVVPT